MNKIAKILITIGILFMMASSFLFLYQGYEDDIAGKKALNILNDIKPMIIKNNENTLSNKNLKEININVHNYIGILNIPKLNLELPINSDSSYESLKIAPGLYYGSIDTNNLIICGHSYKTHFKYLNNLNKGDKIIFTDIFGENYSFEVLKIEILNANEVDKMINNEYDLTLYTCTSDGANRITVRCNRI